MKYQTVKQWLFFVCLTGWFCPNSCSKTSCTTETYEARCINRFSHGGNKWNRILCNAPIIRRNGRSQPLPGVPSSAATSTSGQSHTLTTISQGTPCKKRGGQEILPERCTLYSVGVCGRYNGARCPSRPPLHPWAGHSELFYRAVPQAPSTSHGVHYDRGLSPQALTVRALLEGKDHPGKTPDSVWGTSCLKNHVFS